MTTKTKEPVTKRTNVRPHRLGMGWHYVWEYDPPIVQRGQRQDGTTHEWQELGESSEGGIVWLADQFAREQLGGITAREIYGRAYQERDGESFDDKWLATDALRDAWDPYTVSPKRWTPALVRRLFEDLEDVNYHSFLAELITQVKAMAPRMARTLPDWCR